MKQVFESDEEFIKYVEDALNVLLETPEHVHGFFEDTWYFNHMYCNGKLEMTEESAKAVIAIAYDTLIDNCWCY